MTPDTNERRWEDTAALAMAAFLLFAGVSHFTNPDFFDAIVPPWLPPSERFWTSASGVAEIVISATLLRRSTRRAGALAAAWLFLAVYPANLYMTWDWRDRAWTEQLVSWGRLPFQFVFIWVAVRIARRESSRTAPSVPGDVSL
ncbi:MAG: hypothetical protein ACKOCC_06545 [Actinomycetota bacterium]